MRRETKATGITDSVRCRVATRDEIDGWPCCIICGKPAPYTAATAFSCAHFIPRSQGGLGVEENIVTLCPRCHSMYDQGIDRRTTAEYIEEYLKQRYPNWNREKLTYKKGK
ncbi:MAG: HNH endonuclease [Oscillospiraceae bacterium]|nr:HNH endonuclease [Oscillospiraceae bacterium]